MSELSGNLFGNIFVHQVMVKLIVRQKNYNNFRYHYVIALRCKTVWVVKVKCNL